MARYVGPVCKLCRREEQKLFLKGSKCMSPKCPVEKRTYPPGQHGTARRFKKSEYQIQLREKQKVKRIYGLLERQFHKTFANAERQKGITSEILLQLLERRLDNVIYRLGFAPSRKAARQLVLHRHFYVNDRVVNIPSYTLNAGDVVRVKEKSKKLEAIHASLKRMRDGKLMPWLDLDKAGMKGSLLNIPSRADIPLEANESLIVELYSK
ncbi:30S ribosomal protein S4 [candidate division KSB1 bacterium]|nr:30S ribosomal protein S4 [candidate division KSB1 bacterium]NIR70216.1 30S ribosomal protein S4 [candidate division KSB1 bacterium]NIS26487.1 30S ribosomal protein S4 [candidate division KSB1 bacterium]NIT73249.1 30S ribosomal protein S4 [candidate division KSB1 bacterium]NIU23873.1 30S ribosomal protein S4 [candidate division KSB1 bacterium]